MRHRLPIPNLHSNTKRKSRANIIGESLSEAKWSKNVEPCVNKVKQAEIERKKAHEKITKHRSETKEQRLEKQRLEKRKQLALDAQQQKLKRIIPRLKETGILKRLCQALSVLGNI